MKNFGLRGTTVDRELIDALEIKFKSAFRNLKSAILTSPLLFALCVPVWAQQPKQFFRVGYLSPQGESREFVRAEAIRLALRKLGYIEGQNIAIEYRFAEGKLDRLPELAAELVRLKVDIIVTAGGYIAIAAAKNATTSIPIIMVGAGIDPVVSGLVESLAHPGGNLTGVTNLSPELGGKRLELLKEAVLRIARVAVLHDPGARSSVREMNELLPKAAQALGLSIQPWEVRAVGDFDKVFGSMAKQRPGGLYPTGGPLMNANEKRIADFAINNRIPSIFSTRASVEVGGLMYYGADVAHSYQRVAYYIDRIVKGAKPAHLPVEQPTKFEFVINLKTAKQIGLTIPPNVLARADKVIK
jgi:putative ABC transport system substrate-binding protein